MAKEEVWICDSCGEVIEKPKDGVLEWICDTKVEGKPKGRGLRLVHQAAASPTWPDGKCGYDSDAQTVEDVSLEGYTGPDGLLFLLRLIAEEEVPIEEVLEMIMRLHIPGYEWARLYADDAMAEGVVVPNPPHILYRQSHIDAILEHARNTEASERERRWLER